MLPAPAPSSLLPPPASCCIFKSGFSLFVRFTNRKIASDYTTCSPFWSVRASSSAWLASSLVAPRLLLSPCLHKYCCIYLCRLHLHFAIAHRLQPSRFPLPPTRLLCPTLPAPQPPVQCLQLGQLTLRPCSSWAAQKLVWLNGCTRRRLTRSPSPPPPHLPATRLVH